MEAADPALSVAAVEAAAARFVAEHVSPPPSTAVESLSSLARAIDRFSRADVSPALEGAFLDGAGAQLALVLVGSIRGARLAIRDGILRVQLGHGAFDPFTAIERALDAERVRDCLVSEVARAEAEAAGHGPIARVARALDVVLHERAPDRVVTERFDRRVWLVDGTEIDLARTIEATADQDPRAVRAAVEKLVSMLTAAAPLDREAALAALVPRIVGPGFEVPAPLVLLSAPADLRIALLVSMKDRARFVTTADLDRWQLTPDEALEQAVTNLAARSERARLARLDTAAGPLVFFRSGDGLDAARLLLPALVETLAPELGLPFVAAVPHRDVLWCASDRPALRAALEARVRDDHARAPHAISTAILTVRDRPVPGGSDRLRAR